VRPAAVSIARFVRPFFKYRLLVMSSFYARGTAALALDTDSATLEACALFAALTSWELQNFCSHSLG
jgi:hypothetical protein